MFLWIQQWLERDLSYRFVLSKNIADISLGILVKDGFNAGNRSAIRVGSISEIVNIPRNPCERDPAYPTTGAVHYSTTDIV